MKKLLFTLQIIFAAFLLQAQQNYLNITDPRGWGIYDPGKIKDAEIFVKPKGMYMEVGMYFTISTANYFSYYDTLEIAMNFNLPKGSFIHDSWLWVDSIIMRAELLERWKAYNIYEGIVQRRKDPSLLVDNGNNNYQINIFPLAGNSERKIKITYMVPTVWSNQKVSASLPIEIIKLSSIIPNVQIGAYRDVTWNNPELFNNGLSISANNIQSGLSSFIINSATVANSNSLQIEYKTPAQNGLFFETYHTSNDEGFYQMIMMPKEVLQISTSKKILFLIDYASIFTTQSRSILLNNLKASVKQYFSEADSFNVMVYTNQAHSMNTDWVQATETNIDDIFQQLQNIIFNYNTVSLMYNGFTFLKNHGGDGQIVFLTNNNLHEDIAYANTIANDIIQMRAPYNFPIHVLSYMDNNIYNAAANWNNNEIYIGSEFFNKKLALETGGNYMQMISENDYYYYQNPSIVNSFSTILNTTFPYLDGKITDFDTYTSANNGFCYGRFDISNNNVAYLSKPVMQVGKYYGNAPFNIDISGRYNNNIFSQTITTNNIYTTTDTLVKKMWANQYLKELIQSTPVTNQIAREIIDTSINNRVLCSYTAFLALEPNDTLFACERCNDETNGENPALTIIEEDSISIQVTAHPNPFYDLVTIKGSMKNDQTNDNLIVNIYNLQGQIVYSLKDIKIVNHEFSIEWNGIDNNETVVPSGVYIAQFKSEKVNQKIRIVKF